MAESIGVQPAAQPSPTPVPQQTFLQKLVLQAANLFTAIFHFARYAYLLRVQIGLALVLVGFPIASLLPGSPLRELFQNLFWMDGGGKMWPWPTFWSTMAALVLAWSLLLTARIVLLNCGDRFSVPSLMSAASLRGWHFFAVLVLALPAIGGQFTQQGDFRPHGGFCSQCLLAVVAAVVSSYILAFIALWFAVILAPPGTQGSALTFPGFPFMRRWLEWADHHHILPKGIGPGIWIRKNLPLGLWRGYLASDGFLWSGHWLALLFGLATVGLYFFVDWWHGRELGEASGVTALTFVLLLLLNANWILSFLTFFLDRFRIPVLVPLIVFALISGNQRSSDYYFQVRPPAISIHAVSPGDVLQSRTGKPIVVVATAGGGIQAAAWTTKVLAGLEQQYDKWFPGKSFAENVTAISSISGGATGSMFYLNLYDASAPHHFRIPDLDGLSDVASESSLDDVAWAMVYHDIPQIFFSGPRGSFDRGYVLEETWSKRAKLTRALSEWRDGVKDGWRPAAIFNSTISETGEPIAFSTTAWQQDLDPNTGKPILPRRRDFFDMYPAEDLRVVTATRLAASFPFVTPAARPMDGQPDGFHLIDGGYYDNYGVSSLIAWLEEGLTETHATIHEKASDKNARQDCAAGPLPCILVIQIRSFPPDDAIHPTKKGWGFQLYVPIKGLLSVRTAAQLVRDREALSLFARRWEPDTAETPQARIQFATFEFGGFQSRDKDKALNPPLSWAMNPSQIQAVKEYWHDSFEQPDPKQNDPNLDKVHCFFDPNFFRCSSLSRRPE